MFEANKSDPEKPFCGVDVVKCRKNTLANCRHPFPIFSPFDVVEAAREGCLADLSFIDTGKCQAAELTRIPYLGPGWYSKTAVAYMLETGVAKWSDIKWSLDATAHVPAGIFARALRIMDRAWEDPCLSKLSVNSMIGLFAKDVSQVLSVQSSHNELDGAGSDFKQIFAYGDSAHIFDFVFSTRFCSNATYRPIHDFVMGFEHVMVAHAARYMTHVVGLDRRYLS